MVSLRQIAKGILSAGKYAAYAGSVAVVTAGCLGWYADRHAGDKPTNVYQNVAIENTKEKKDIVVRLESGRNEIMLRQKAISMEGEPTQTLVNLRTIRSDDLESLKEAHKTAPRDLTKTYEMIREQVTKKYNALEEALRTE